MEKYKDLYEFAASAGAFEGYVYHMESVNPDYLPRWVDNLGDKYYTLPYEVRAEIQDFCDGTLGRAVQSLITVLRDKYEVIGKLKKLIQEKILSSPNDFSKQD